MKKLIIIAFWLVLTSNIFSQPLPVKYKQSVIIDTDCALDDMRAIVFLLSRPEIEIKAIVTSDGTLPPAEGYNKITGLLQFFQREAIPVGTGVLVKGINPPWRSMSRNITWGKEPESLSAPMQAVELIRDKLTGSNEPLTILCLGALTNMSSLISKYPDAKDKIERIVWYNESVKQPGGFNYECDPSAAEKMLTSGIRMDVISNLGKNEVILDNSFLETISNTESPILQLFQNVYNAPAVHDLFIQNHFSLTDDLAALYLLNPELFNMNILLNNVKIRFNQDYQAEALKEAFNDLISGAYVAEKNVVFNRFPRNRELFTYDVRQIMDSAIALHGLEEWKANVMTDEFHGHLGVFSIVGAKMGIKARELFGVGPDELRVVSFAGNRPPYSCMNDGIQVSTGATLGMGTIELAKDSLTRPVAIFTHKNHSFMLTLKPEYLKLVNSDISEGITKFGLSDDGYWKLVRRNALNYWLHWDRNEIFDIKEIQDYTENRPSVNIN